MFPSAKDILRNHKQVLARLQVARMELRQYAEMHSTEKDETIQSMVLSGRALDGMPKSRRHGSSTEYVALHYADQADGDQPQIESHIHALQQEISSIKMQLKLHKAILNLLTETEARFVALHYDDGLTFVQLSEIQFAPSENVLYSISTLRRMNQTILRMAELLIHPQAKSQRATIYIRASKSQ